MYRIVRYMAWTLLVFPSFCIAGIVIVDDPKPVNTEKVEPKRTEMQKRLENVEREEVPEDNSYQTKSKKEDRPTQRPQKVQPVFSF